MSVNKGVLEGRTLLQLSPFGALCNFHIGCVQYYVDEICVAVVHTDLAKTTTSRYGTGAVYFSSMSAGPFS
jgi:hypothetical protein